VKEWLRRTGGAVVMGLIWAAVWAAVGALMGLVDPSGSTDALWLGPAIGLLPGFVGGLIFSVLLGIAARRRRLDEMSLSKAIACGGMAGLLVGMLPFAINQPPGEAPLWLVGVVVIGSMTLLSAVSAAGSLALVRSVRAGRR
jgi:hypothetical protein